MKITENFEFEEIADNETQSLRILPLVYFHMDLLQELRNELGRIKINSGYRTPHHNEEVGGARNSMHLMFATDIVPLDSNLERAYVTAKMLGFTGIGRYDTFLHLDCREHVGRPPAEWDNRS